MSATSETRLSDFTAQSYSRLDYQKAWDAQDSSVKFISQKNWDLQFSFLHFHIVSLEIFFCFF